LLAVTSFFGCWLVIGSCLAGAAIARIRTVPTELDTPNGSGLPPPPEDVEEEGAIGPRSLPIPNFKVRERGCILIFR
jgi:hypothetical protein